MSRASVVKECHEAYHRHHHHHHQHHHHHHHHHHHPHLYQHHVVPEPHGQVQGSRARQEVIHLQRENRS